MQSNVVLVQKAVDLQVADLMANGGFLVDEQLPNFIQVPVPEATITDMCTVRATSRPELELPNLRFVGRVLKPGTSKTRLADADRSKPNIGKTLAKPRFFKGEIDLDDETIEDNIEGEGFKDSIVAAAGRAVKRDREDVCINGDTASADPTLAVFNGWLKQITTNTFDCGFVTTSAAVLEQIRLKLPKEFRKSANLKYFASSDARLEYQKSIMDRIGDRATAIQEQGEDNVRFAGKEVVEVPMMPQTLTSGLHVGNTTDIIHADAKNLHIVVRRDILFKRQEDAAGGFGILVVSTRFVSALEFEPATALGFDIAL